MDYLKVVRTLLLTVVMRIEQIPYSRAAPSACTIALAILSEELGLHVPYAAKPEEVGHAS